jgi:NAD(P)-dependent dehydrogenase (short-subunit alcohol dehydrogenase family)
LAKTWFITGASKGFGREWTEAALERGDKVAATARNPQPSMLWSRPTANAVLPIELDVTDRSADFEAVKKAADSFGQLDVVINNAGYGHFGAIEELSEDDVRSQLETNLFGALWVTQAALPIMRTQGFGHIIQVSSIGGITAFPPVGAYHASKWALEGFSQALSQEVADFGIKVTLIEAGGYSTDWAGPSSKHSDENPAYSGVRDARNRARAGTPPGDPRATRRAILKVVDADAPPLPIFFGKVPLGIATADYESGLAAWNAWQPISVEAHGSQ